MKCGCNCVMAVVKCKLYRSTQILLQQIIQKVTLKVLNMGYLLETMEIIIHSKLLLSWLSHEIRTKGA